MDNVIFITKSVIVLYAVYTVGMVLFRERKSYEFVWSTWRSFKVEMFLECFSVIFFTIALSVALAVLFPVLQFSWTSFLYDGESGNVLVKPMLDGTQSPSVIIRISVALFFLVLAFILPYLARAEEKAFRKGCNTWWRVILSSVIFGPFHCLMGVPLAAGIGLILPGLYFGWKYKQAYELSLAGNTPDEAEDLAVVESTNYHSMYNMILISLGCAFTIYAIF